jgi:hypothetical protein
MRVFGVIMTTLALLVGTVAAQEDGLVSHFTYQQASGNRIVAGVGTFPDVTTVDYATASPPVWVLGSTDLETGAPRWRFLLADGSFHLTAGESTAMPMAIRFEPGEPVAFGVDTVETYYPGKGADASPLTHPISLGTPSTQENNSLYIAQNGDVVSLSNDFEVSRLPINALPDARPVVNRGGQIAIYTGATDQRYAHGVLGDTLEAASLTILNVDGATLAVATQIELDGDSVFEGIAPIWADVDGDGADDLITTMSNGVGGAQLRVFRADGAPLADGEAIGQGNRWRHQLAFGAFGVNGETELVDILTPHIGGVVEYFRLNGNTLERAASITGYSSHGLGSRNLDMAVAGDFNGDGQLEMVVPDQAQTRIAGLQRTADGIVEIWSLPLDGGLTSNLFALTLPDGRLALAAGTDANVLRAWIPN